MTNEELLQEAKKARLRAYAPYSHFLVGAALLTEEGRLYHGCNIENAAYGPGSCAERTAFFKAVCEGERHFAKIAIAGAPEGEEAVATCAPCGICRQVMAEFCDKDAFKIILADGSGGVLELSLKELLPYAFGPENLPQ